MHAHMCVCTVCMYVYVRMYVCMCVYVRMHVCTYVCILYMQTCIIHLSKYVCHLIMDIPTKLL